MKPRLGDADWLLLPLAEKSFFPHGPHRARIEIWIDGLRVQSGLQMEPCILRAFWPATQEAGVLASLPVVVDRD